jgi:hypothetical protein
VRVEYARARVEDTGVRYTQEARQVGMLGAERRAPPLVLCHRWYRRCLRASPSTGVRVEYARARVQDPGVRVEDAGAASRGRARASKGR